MTRRAPSPPLNDIPWLVKNVFFKDISIGACRLRERYGHRVRTPGVLPASGGSTQLFTHPDDVQEILQKKPSKFASMQSPGSEDFEKVTRNSIVSLREESKVGSWVDRLRVLAEDFQTDSIDSNRGELVRTINASLTEFAGEKHELLNLVRRITIRLMGVSLFGPDIRAHEEDIIWAVSTLRRAFKQKHLRVAGNVRFREGASVDDAIETLESVAESVVNRRVRTPHLFDDAIVRWLNHLPADVVQREVVGMLLAGFTTLSAGLTWCTYELAKRPLLQNAIRESVVKDGDVGSTSELARSVWNETLRLYSPLPVFGRRAKENVAVNGYEIYEGERVLISPFVTHRDPQFWDGPEAFAPRRFMDHRPSQFEFYPFGVGPHACLGREIANAEATAFISALCSLYKPRLLTDKRPGVDTAVNLQPDRDINVVLNERGI